MHNIIKCISPFQGYGNKLLPLHDNQIASASSSERALYSDDKFRTVLVGSYTDPIIAQIIKPDNEKIAESNNLTKRVEIVSSDKIGGIAGCFNSFVEKQHSIISQISSNFLTLARSSDELAKGSI